MKKYFLLLLFLAVLQVCAREINPEKIAEENRLFIASKIKQLPAPEVKIEMPKFSHKTSLPPATKRRTHILKLKGKTSFPDGTRFVIFGVDDVSKELFRRDNKFSYGYCINFNDLKEIEEMKNQFNLKFPISIITNDKIWKEVFKISSYPAVIEIKGTTLIIKEGL